MINRNFPLFILFFTLAGWRCSTQNLNYEMMKEGHYNLYSFPEKNQWNKDQIKVVLAGTNNIESSFFPYLESPYHSKGKGIYVGGADNLSKYLEILNQEYQGRSFLFDAGEMIDHQNFKLTDLISYTKKVPYDALSYDEQLFQALATPQNSSSQNPTLVSYFKQSGKLHISSNLIEVGSAKPPPWKNFSRYFLKEKQGVKVGVIQILPQKSWKKFDLENFKGLYLKNDFDTIERYSQILRGRGADLVVLLSSYQLNCTRQKAGVHNSKLNFVPEIIDSCDRQSPLLKILKDLPPGSLDVVFNSGGASKVANNFYDIPVLQNFGKAQYLSWIQFSFKKDGKDLRKTGFKIEQPIKLCSKFYLSSMDCFSNDQTMDYSKIVNASFLGHVIP